MPRSPWKAEGHHGCPSLAVPLSEVSDTVTSKDPPRGGCGACVVCTAVSPKFVPGKRDKTRRY